MSFRLCSRQDCARLWFRRLISSWPLLSQYFALCHQVIEFILAEIAFGFQLSGFLHHLCQKCVLLLHLLSVLSHHHLQSTSFVGGRTIGLSPRSARPRALRVRGAVSSFLYEHAHRAPPFSAVPALAQVVRSTYALVNVPLACNLRANNGLFRKGIAKDHSIQRLVKQCGDSLLLRYSLLLVAFSATSCQSAVPARAFMHAN